MPTEQQRKIAKVLDSLTDGEVSAHLEAIARGHKDKDCKECGASFLSHQSLVRCDSETCPMKSRDSDGRAKSLLDILTE